MKKYVVGCPTRGVQFYLVEAKSKSDALRKVRGRAGEYFEEVHIHSFSIVHEGQPREAIEADWIDDIEAELTM